MTPAGRPPVTGEARDEIVRVRMTSAERAKLQAQADAAGKPLALWIHDKLFPRRAAKRSR
jgi:hypothetical protein